MTYAVLHSGKADEIDQFHFSENAGNVILRHTHATENCIVNWFREVNRTEDVSIDQIANLIAATQQCHRSMLDWMEKANQHTNFFKKHVDEDKKLLRTLNVYLEVTLKGRERPRAVKQIPPNNCCILL